MLTPLILFFGLAVATAVIAHWSDNLGKKLGKKRVSLMGLRPRTTATVLTVASSWCIMIFTLAAMLLAVEPLRRALFSYDAERKQARLDREQAEIDINAERELLAKTRAQSKAANEQLGAVRSQLVAANASVISSRRDVKDAKDAATKAKIAGKKAEEFARKQAEAAQREVVTAQKRVDDAQSNLVKAQIAEVAAQKQAGRDQLASQQAKNDLGVARNYLSVAQKQLKATQAKYKITKSQYESAQINLKRIQLQYGDVKTKLFAKSRELLASEEQLKEVQRQFAVNELERVAFAANDAPVKVDQVFAATKIAANQRPEVIVQQLNNLLQQGRESFAEIEDTSPQPNFPASTTLQLLPSDVQDTDGKIVRLQGQPLLRFIARDIRRQTTADLISVRLVAWRNHLAGEANIWVKFDSVPIKPAFAAGDVLASATIDGSQGDARIFHSLMELTDLGRQTAEKKGVNPPESPDEPNFYDKGTIVRLFEALRPIENSKARLTVNLVADHSLSTVDPLQVRFEIEGIKGQPTS